MTAIQYRLFCKVLDVRLGGPAKIECAGRLENLWAGGPVEKLLVARYESEDNEDHSRTPKRCVELTVQPDGAPS